MDIMEIKETNNDFSVLEEYISSYGKIKWPNTLGYVTYKRTYARRLNDDDPNSDTEEFAQTLYRVIRACNEQLNMNLSPEEQCEYFKMFATFKALPAGRFLWQLGTKTVEKYGLLSLQNCAFTEVKSIDSFWWVFDCLMLGSGIGFNIQRRYTDQLPKPYRVTVVRKDTNDADFIVPDSREGWIALLRYLLRAHFVSDYCIQKSFTYSCICLRSKGASIKGFGGTASGPEHLCQGIDDINKIINLRASEEMYMRPIDCLDIMNLIARTVISGNVRRCLPVGTLVHTTTGLVPIEKMTTDHMVRTHKGDYTVTDVMVQGKQKLICIETEIGRFKCTDNHRMAVWDNSGVNKYIWKTAKSITTYDSLVHVTHVIDGFDTKIDDIDNNPILDTSTAFFMGYAHGNVQTCKCVLPDASQKLVGKVTFQYNNFMTFFKPESFKFIVTLNDDDFTIISSSFAKHMYSIKFTGHIPHYILQASVKIRQSYIKGYEMYKLHTHGTMYAIHHNIFLYELNALYASLGIRTCADTVNYTLKYVDLPFTGQGIFEYFNPTQALKPIKITNICQLHNKVDTYDITVQCVEQFVVGGGILTHNSAQIAIGDYDDIAFLNAKRWDKGNIPNWRCFSNNSVVCNDITTLPNEFWEGYEGNGECYGLINLELSKKIGRTGETQYPDPRVSGYNPCGEQSLEHAETCCLQELFLPNINTQEELFKCAKNMYRIAKHSMSLPCHQKETDSVVHNNMRMGIGITGVLQAPDSICWLDKTYKQLRDFDKKYSEDHGFPQSIKLTTIKPSGCVNPKTLVVINNGSGIENKTFEQIFEDQGYTLGDNDDVGDTQTWFDVTSPFTVLDENNDMQNVTRLYDNGVRETVHLKINNEDIYCTPDHKFKVGNKWVRASDLIYGDIIKCY